MALKKKKKFTVSDVDGDYPQSYTFEAKSAWGDTNTWSVSCKDQSYLSCKVIKIKDQAHQQINLEIRSKEELSQLYIEIQDICNAKRYEDWHQLKFTNTADKSITLTFATLSALNAVHKHISQWEFEYVPNCAYFVNF